MQPELITRSLKPSRYVVRYGESQPQDGKKAQYGYYQDWFPLKADRLHREQDSKGVALIFRVM